MEGGSHRAGAAWGSASSSARDGACGARAFASASRGGRGRRRLPPRPQLAASAALAACLVPLAVSGLLGSVGFVASRWPRSCPRADPRLAAAATGPDRPTTVFKPADEPGGRDQGSYRGRGWEDGGGPEFGDRGGAPRRASPWSDDRGAAAPRRPSPWNDDRGEAAPPRASPFGDGDGARDGAAPRRASPWNDGPEDRDGGGPARGDRGVAAPRRPSPWGDDSGDGGGGAAPRRASPLSDDPGAAAPRRPSPWGDGGGDRDGAAPRRASRWRDEPEDRRGGPGEPWGGRSGRPRQQRAWARSPHDPEEGFGDDEDEEVPRQRPRDKNFVNPRLLAAKLRHARSEREISYHIESNINKISLNAIHVSAAFHALASMEYTLTQDFAESRNMQDLAAHTKLLAIRGDLGSRETATVLRAIAALRQKVPACGDLVQPLLALVPNRVSNMSTWELSNVIWSVGDLMPEGPATGWAVSAAEEAAVQRIKEFSLMDVAETLWGLAAWGSPAVQSPLVPELLRRLRYLPAQADHWPAIKALPKIACALVRLGIWDPIVMDEIAYRLTRVIGSLRLWGLAAIYWAWTRPCSEPRAPTSASERSDSRSRQYVVHNFMRLLEEQVESRGVTQEDIESSPAGPGVRPAAPARMLGE